jgi:hypothetical protein
MGYVRLSAIGLWLCLLLCAALTNTTWVMTSKVPLTFDGGAALDYCSVCAIALAWGSVHLLAFVSGGVLASLGTRRSLAPLVRSWALGREHPGAQEPLRFVNTMSEALVVVGVAAAVRLWRFAAGALHLRSLEDIGLARIAVVASISVLGFVVVSYGMERRFEAERTARLQRCIAGWLGVSGWVVPMVVVVLTRGVAVTWLCIMFLKGAREVWFAGTARWNWSRRLSLACALFLFWLSYAREPSGARRILTCFRAGFQGLGSAGDHGIWWAAVAAAAFLTCLGHLSGFRAPRVFGRGLAAASGPSERGEPLHRRETTPAARLGRVAQWILGGAFGAVALYGAARWPGNDVWYIVLALTGAGLVAYTDTGSFAVTVFVLVPRWAIWLLVLRQASWKWAAFSLCCEFLFLLPSIWPPDSDARTSKPSS